jgi:hypothetical protein
LSVESGRIVARCGGGGTLAVLELEIDGLGVAPDALYARTGAASVALGSRRPDRP